MNKLLDSPGLVFVPLEMKGITCTKEFPEVRKPIGILPIDQYDIK